MAEGAPLLRAYRRNLIEGSNPSLSAIHKQPGSAGFFVYGGERLEEKPPVRKLRKQRRRPKAAPKGRRI